MTQGVVYLLFILLLSSLSPSFSSLSLLLSSASSSPPHYGVEVCNLLNIFLPNNWIGRRATIEWPARSPDLTPMDFYFWGGVIDQIFKQNPQTVPDMTQLKEKKFMKIRNYVIKCVWVSHLDYRNVLMLMARYLST